MFSKVSVRWKIYFIAIVSIIGFGSYLAFNVWVNTKNTELLTNVRDTYFPILEKSTANGVRLERMSELLNTAVLTGEIEYIESADSTANIMRQDFSAIHKLEPLRKHDIVSIQSTFEDYYQIAKTIAEDMTTGEADFAIIGTQVKKKESVLASLEEQLEKFRLGSHKNFTGNINDANHNSEFMLTSGFIIWGVSILILTLTVYTIARVILSSIISVSKSLHNIAQGEDAAQNIPVTSKDEIGDLTVSFNELMDKLRERTNDLMSMMQNMHQGLFTITEDGSIHKEYSAYIEEIFATTHVANQQYNDLLFSHADIGSDQLNQVQTAVSSLLGEDEMMFEFNKHCLIQECNVLIQSNDSVQKKILELDWDPIIADETINKIMVTVRDVTAIRAMQAEAEEQKKELDILGQILKVTPAKFNGFIENARTLLNKNESIIKANTTKDAHVVADLFVNMHTIKGNSRTYHLSAITDLVHDAETTYDRLRKEDNYTWDPKQLLAELTSVRDAVELYARVKQEKLANAESAEMPEGSVLIHKEHYQSLLNECDKLVDANTQPLSHMLRQLNTVPLEEAISDLIESLPSVAAQLGKPAPLVKPELDNLLLQKEYIELMNNVFTHLLRNAIDHGIENDALRKEKGKPPQGTIHLASDITRNTAILWLWDDGQGINLKRLKSKALEAGQLNEEQLSSPTAIANCLFMSGVSTAEKVSAISGRGVGMDAVKKYLQDKNCDVEIVLNDEASQGAEFAPFKIKVTLAKTLYLAV